MAALSQFVRCSSCLPAFSVRQPCCNPIHYAEQQLIQRAACSWYAVNLASTRLYSLAQWVDWESTSEQYKWFSKDLAALDRKAFPWVIVQMHGEETCSTVVRVNKFVA